jgi:hypothetical protein
LLLETTKLLQAEIFNQPVQQPKLLWVMDKHASNAEQQEHSQRAERTQQLVLATPALLPGTMKDIVIADQVLPTW